MKRVLVISLLAHVAVFASLARSRPAPAPMPVVPTEEVAIEMVMDPEAQPAPTATGDTVAIAVMPQRSRTGPLEPAPSASSVEAVAETAPYATNGTMIVFAPNIGIGGPNPFLMNAGTGTEGRPGAVASADPMAVPLEKRAEQSVKDALRARDQSIGLGLEGPVVHALEDATHAGFAPDHGTATFVAVIDERGIVIDLKVLSSTASSAAGAHGWEDVRQRAVKSLATAKIDMRGVKRAELKIAVDSEVLLPSGNKPGAFPIQPSLKPQKQGVILQTESPGPTPAAAGGEVARFDLTDIDAKKQRVVHAKLVLITTR